MIEVTQAQYEYMLNHYNSGVEVFVDIGGIPSEYVVVGGNTYCANGLFHVPEQKFELELRLTNKVEDTYSILKPTIRGKKVLIAECSDDILRKYLTDGKQYTPVESCGDIIAVVTDDKEVRWVARNHFVEATYYDEDEDELICRNIELQEGDYLDLRKHTPEQIRHLSKYCKFYDVEGLLAGSWMLAYFNKRTQSLVGDHNPELASGNEYTYDDFFYKEGE